MMEDQVAADTGVVTKLSRESVAGTVARLTDMITAKGMRLFAVIDQAAEARQAGLTLRETTLVIFGSPKAGTPVMAASPMAALDLPLKVLIWAAKGQTKVSSTHRRRCLPATTSPRTWPPTWLASTPSPTR